MTHRGPFQPLLFCDSVKAQLCGGQRAPIAGSPWDARVGTGLTGGTSPPQGNGQNELIYQCYDSIEKPLTVLEKALALHIESQNH